MHIDDYRLAQELLDAQWQTPFEEILNGFARQVFPSMPETVGELSYYWTVWQSEVAKDYIFENGDVLAPLMRDFQRHSFATGLGERILHYFGSPPRRTASRIPGRNRKS